MLPGEISTQHACFSLVVDHRYLGVRVAEVGGTGGIRIRSHSGLGGCADRIAIRVNCLAGRCVARISPHVGTGGTSYDIDIIPDKLLRQVVIGRPIGIGGNRTDPNGWTKGPSTHRRFSFRSVVSRSAGENGH